VKNIDEYRDRGKENTAAEIKPKDVIEERPRDVPIRQELDPAADPHRPDNRVLLDAVKAREFQDRWNVIQTAFVDNPAKAVEDADKLVEDTIKHIADLFAGDREKRASARGTAGQNSTEDLRLGLQRCRTIFNRLMAA
jgi:hypothetical protein